MNTKKYTEKLYDAAYKLNFSRYLKPNEGYHELFKTEKDKYNIITSSPELIDLNMIGLIYQMSVWLTDWLVDCFTAHQHNESY